MKVRDSGMPDELVWQKFYDINLIFEKLQIDGSLNNVVEFGSGYGTFTIPASKIIKEKVIALEIEPDLISTLGNKISSESLRNIELKQNDFMENGTGLNDESVDYAMLFNILHTEKPVALLKEAYRILKPGGKAGIIHWIHSSITPRGPSLDIRPTPLQCVNWLLEANFKILKNGIALPPYHYGILAYK